MSTALRFALLPLFALAMACAAPTDDDDDAFGEDSSALSDGHRPFEVMSYNLRYEQAEDTGPKRWSRRQASVFARIAAHAPDILGVQEAKRPKGDIDYPKALQDELTGAGHAFDAFDPGGGSPKLIFWKRARFELAAKTGAAGEEDLPDGTESASCKGLAVSKKAVWAKLRDRSSGKVYFIVNTHLTNGVCPSTREQSAVAIKKLITARSGGLPVVVMGDMNVDPQGPGADEDTVHILEKRGKDLALAGDYTGATTNARATFNSGWDFSDRDNRRIDYILVGGSKLEPKRYTIDRAKNADGISPSDHFPIVVTIGPR